MQLKDGVKEILSAYCAEFPASRVIVLLDEEADFPANIALAFDDPELQVVVAALFVVSILLTCASFFTLTVTGVSSDPF